MRDIIFRGKRLGNGEWVEGFFAEKKDPLLESDVRNAFILAQARGDFFTTWFPVDPSTVGQYTGLKDKNGKQIFEGDICRNTRTNEIVSVHWHGSMAGFVWNQKRDDSEHLYDFGALFRAHDKYEVIGNIHDNPELLKEDDHGRYESNHRTSDFLA